MRKIEFASGEFYHIYNRGVDKRDVFSDDLDQARFFQSMDEFNVVEPIGSIYENSFAKNDSQLGHSVSKLGEKKLVNFVCYCLNPNHYHFVLEQAADKGIEMFMQRLGNGYTKYFNNKNKRSGALFQGPYKAVHIGSNEQLLHVSAYVNLNDQVHQLGHSVSKLVKSRSSWEEYINDQFSKPFCKKDIILDQFESRKDYQRFAQESLPTMLDRKQCEKELRDSLFE